MTTQRLRRVDDFSCMPPPYRIKYGFTYPKINNNNYNNEKQVEKKQPADDIYTCHFNGRHLPTSVLQTVRVVR